MKKIQKFLMATVVALIVLGFATAVNADDYDLEECDSFDFLEDRPGWETVDYDLDALPYSTTPGRTRMDVGRSNTAQRTTNFLVPGTNSRIGTLTTRGWWDTDTRRIVVGYGHSQLSATSGPAHVPLRTFSPRSSVNFRGRMANNNYRLILRGEFMCLAAFHWADHVYNFHGATYSWRADRRSH